MGNKQRIRVENCASKAHPKASTRQKLVRLKFICSMTWEDLERTDVPALRHCAKCRHPVTLCSTLEQAEQLARDGACIAVPEHLAAQRREQCPSVLVGSPTANAQEQHVLEQWGRRIFAVEP